MAYQLYEIRQRTLQYMSLFTSTGDGGPGGVFRNTFLKAVCYHYESENLRKQ